MFSEIKKICSARHNKHTRPRNWNIVACTWSKSAHMRWNYRWKRFRIFESLSLIFQPQHAAERWGTAEERIGALAWRTDRQTDTKSSTRQPAVTGAYCRPTPVKLLLNDKTDFGELTAVMMLMTLVIAAAAAAAAAAQLCVKSQKVSKLNKIWLGITWVWICKTETGRKLS